MNQRVPSLGEAFLVWLRIGIVSFGGPAGQIALMHRILVEEKRWIDERRFLHALNYCMLLPGPEAMQLATYVGWLLHRIPGGLIAGSLFVLPGALVIWSLAAAYSLFADLPAVEAAFVGIKAAVLVIVLQAVIRVGRRVLDRPVLLTIAIAAFVGIFALQAPFPAIVAGAALAGLLLGRLAPDSLPAANNAEETSAKAGEATLVEVLARQGRLGHVEPDGRRAMLLLLLFALLWFGPILAIAAAPGDGTVFLDVAAFFSKLAVVTFGGAYAVLSYMAQQAVEGYGWLSPEEMLNGLGLAETTPGPLILVTQFVGFIAGFRFGGVGGPLLSGTLAALLTTWVTFVPCFLWVFLGGPYVEGLRRNRALSAALACITAAVVGVILNLAIWFSIHALFGQSRSFTLAGGLTLDLPVWHTLQLPTLGIALAAGVGVFHFRMGVLTTLSGAVALGLLTLLLPA